MKFLCIAFLLFLALLAPSARYSIIPQCTALKNVPRTLQATPEYSKEIAIPASTADGTLETFPSSVQCGLTMSILIQKVVNTNPLILSPRAMSAIVLSKLEYLVTLTKRGIGFVWNRSKEATHSSIEPPITASAENRVAGQIEPLWTHYSQVQIDKLTSGTFHPFILRTLIKCESQNTNIARIDSNGAMGWGLLQFNGTSTWNQYAPQANVTGSPMNPKDAIKVADYMISIGQLHRWTCAYITKLL